MSAELWRTYVEWLKARAPASHANLAPPASEAQIAEVERVTGVVLPNDVKAERVHARVTDGSLSYDLLIRILVAEGDLEGAQRELDALMARKPKYPGKEKLQGILARAIGQRDGDSS